MKRMKTETWVRLAAIGICTAFALVAVYVIVRCFLGILLPFLLAALIASVLRPAAAFLNRRLRLPWKFGGTLLIVGAVVLFSWMLVAFGQWLYGEARELIAALPDMLDDEDNPLRRLIDVIEGFSGGGQETSGDMETLYSMLSGMVEDAIGAASAALTSAGAAVIVRLPRVILSVVVGVIALFYLFFDRGAIRKQLLFFFSEEKLVGVEKFFSRMRGAIGGYGRAYLLLLFLTYAQLLAGFLLLDVDRPAVIAAIVAVVDLLPVFGVGTVLVPWSIFAFLGGNVFHGTGLLILFGVMYIVRQFAEPRLLGSTIGVHPLFSLIVFYAAFSLFGIWGIIIAPIFLYGAKAVFTGLKEESAHLKEGSEVRNIDKGG